MVNLERMIEDRSKESDYLIVLCASREDFDKLMYELENLGWHWRGGEMPTEWCPAYTIEQNGYVYCDLDIHTNEITYTEDYFDDDYISVSEFDECHDDNYQYVSDRLLNFLCGLMGCKE